LLRSCADDPKKASAKVTRCIGELLPWNIASAAQDQRRGA
jgi:hypothetical protein